MRKMSLIFVLSVVSTCLYSTIINVPADQPTIQEGIDAAVNADTVLVQPGTYVENINYNGKNITVASLFLTTQDTIFISGTAAIAGEETLGSADISDQTTHTINNIKALIKRANLQANGIKGEANSIFDMIRVYVKNEMDANQVEQLVKELLPADQYTFVVSDICRDNLLVEIEGIVSLHS